MPPADEETLSRRTQEPQEPFCAAVKAHGVHRLYLDARKAADGYTGASGCLLCALADTSSPPAPDTP